MNQGGKAHVYQIDFTAVASGKRIASSKRRVRWRFGFANLEALASGETGTACRGEEHDVTLVWSITSGKRLILADGQEVHYSNSRNAIFDFSWTMRGNHVLKIVAHASPPMTPTPGFRQYDFFVDGQTFFTFPKVFRLGLAPNDPRGSGPSSPTRLAESGQRYGAGGGSGGGGGGPKSEIASLEAPSNPHEEEAYLQEAIRQSLQADKAGSTADSGSGDLLDFGGDGGGAAPAAAAPPALPPSTTAAPAAYGGGYPAIAGGGYDASQPAAQPSQALVPAPAAAAYDPVAAGAPYAAAPAAPGAPLAIATAGLEAPPQQFVTPQGQQTPSTIGFASPPADFSGYTPQPPVAAPAPVPEEAPVTAAAPVSTEFAVPAVAAAQPSGEFGQPLPPPSGEFGQPLPPPSGEFGRPLPPPSGEFAVQPAPSGEFGQPAAPVAAAPSTEFAAPAAAATPAAPAPPAGPTLTMNQLSGEEGLLSGTSTQNAGTMADQAYAKLVNMDTFTLGNPSQPPAPASNPFDGAAVNAVVGGNQSLADMKAKKEASGEFKKDVMKAPPSGAMVVSDQQNGSWGQYGAGMQQPGYGGMGMQQPAGGMAMQQPAGGMGMQQQQPGMGMQQQQAPPASGIAGPPPLQQPAYGSGHFGQAAPPNGSGHFGQPAPQMGQPMAGGMGGPPPLQQQPYGQQPQYGQQQQPQMGMAQPGFGGAPAYGQQQPGYQ